jgi:hypothetical protein
LAIFQGIHLAWFNAAVLVLEEGALIVAILFEAFLVDEALVEIVDSVRLDSLVRPETNSTMSGLGTYRRRIHRPRRDPSQHQT